MQCCFEKFLSFLSEKKFGLYSKIHNFKTT